MNCKCGGRIFTAMRQTTRDRVLHHDREPAVVYVICYECAKCHSSHCYIGARKLFQEDHVSTWVLVEGQPDSTYEAFQTILARAQEDEREAHSTERIARWRSNISRVFSKMYRPGR